MRLIKIGWNRNFFMSLKEIKKIVDEAYADTLKLIEKYSELSIDYRFLSNFVKFII